MTQEQQRIAIAEACGWKNCAGDSGFTTRYKGTPSETTVRVTLPDYINDLNAMHEAVKMLNYDQRNKYLNILCELTREDEMDDVDGDFAWCDATASQRAEAFLKTLGRWES